MKRTPLYSFHVERGAKMVDFAGWEMPLHYGSILEEHRAVREHVGLFDVSHMGRIRFSGRGARRLLERVLARRISNMKPSTCRYTVVCNERGGVKDDVIVYRFDDHWMMVCNASNREKLLAHFDAEAGRGELSVKIEDQTERTAMVALQGPEAMEMVGRFSSEIPTLKRFHFRTKNLMILKMTLSRTGYTGENGVEVILPANMVSMAMKLLVKDSGGQSPPVQPAGLGCRDTLRIEAALPLYGHELSEEIDPIAAGLGFAVTLEKGMGERPADAPEEPTFIGQEALREIAERGPSRKLIGLRLTGRRTARQGMSVRRGEEEIGEVASGCLSPTLGYPIATAFADAAHAEPGTPMAIDFGRTTVDAEVVKLPFYKSS